MSELKPCPFCGSEDCFITVTDNPFSYDTYSTSHCSKCHATGPFVAESYLEDEAKPTRDYMETMAKEKWQTRPIEDDLRKRIAELEADKERLNSCESALISMVNQFFYNKAGENIFRHSFMSAEEEAAEYLVEHGIARWVGKNKSAICFNEVQE